MFAKDFENTFSNNQLGYKSEFDLVKLPKLRLSLPSFFLPR